MNRIPMSTEVKMTGENVPFDRTNITKEASALSKRPVITLYWVNSECVSGAPMAATGKVVGYAIDGEERACLLFVQADRPGFMSMPRAIVGTQIVAVEAPEAMPQAKT